MPWVSRLANGSSEVADQADVAHQLGEEARYSRCRMACSMPPMYWSMPPLAPVGDALVDRGRGVVRAGVAQEVPGRLEEGVHGVGFAPGVATAFRALGFVELGHLASGEPAPVI